MKNSADEKVEPNRAKAVEKITTAAENFIAAEMPTKKEIEVITDKIEALLFPVQFGGRKFDLGEKLRLAAEIYSLLTAAIKKTLKIATRTKREFAERGADEIAENFLEGLGEVKRKALGDAEAIFEGDPAAECVDEVVSCYPGFEATFIYRAAHLLHECGAPIIPRMMTECARSRTGIDIHPAATIGERFSIDHGAGAVIGETAAIGNGVRIYHGVTLGAMSLKNAAELVGKKRHPTVCDNVTLYSGAVILGGNTVIGRGATVGAGEIVCSSVPAETVFATKK